MTTWVVAPQATGRTRQSRLGVGAAQARASAGRAGDGQAVSKSLAETGQQTPPCRVALGTQVRLDHGVPTWSVSIATGATRRVSRTLENGPVMSLYFQCTVP